MTYCSSCGRPIDRDATFCPECGAKQNAAPLPAVTDDGNFLWAVLGFFVPIAGLILWALWMSDRPRDARMAGMGALVSLIFGVVITILLFAVIFANGEIKWEWST